MSEELIDAARSLADELSKDIQLAKTREEHVRVTARANAAAALYNGMITVSTSE